MSALADLRVVVAEQKRRKQEELAAEKRRWRGEKLGQFMREVTNRCLPELLMELQADFLPYDDSVDKPHLILTYRGHSETFWSDTSFILNLPHSIVDWVNQVDVLIAEKERLRLEMKKAMVQALDDAQSAYQVEQAKTTIEKHGLMEFPSVYDAMQAAMERVAAIRRQEEEEACKAAEYLLTEVLEMSLETGWASRLEDIERDLCHMDYNLLGQALVTEILDAIEATNTRLNKEYEQREARRIQAQAEAFHPFYYYRIHYALVVLEDDDQFVGTHSIHSLSPDPDEDGWYVDVHYKQRQRLSHVCRVEQFVISEPDNIPFWCPTRETEWGVIRVPPANAECMDL
jgi:hypothetical protein